jgi:hypothetical protein
MSRTVYVRQSLIKWRYWNDPTHVRRKVIFAHNKYSWHQQWRNYNVGSGLRKYTMNHPPGKPWKVLEFLSAQDLASRTIVRVKNTCHIYNTKVHPRSVKWRMTIITHNCIQTSLESPFRSCQCRRGTLNKAVQTQIGYRVHLPSNFPPFITQELSGLLTHVNTVSGSFSLEVYLQNLNKWQSPDTSNRG